MKKHEGLFQKVFGGIGYGSRVPLRSNVFSGGGGRGYSPIGGTANRMFSGMRESPLLGNASPSNRLSMYYQRVDELRGYQLLDISKLATNFFSDYIINFLVQNTGEVITIVDEEGNKQETETERINDILLKQIKIFDFIRDHSKDYVYYGEYFSMLGHSRDDLGHLVFNIEELYDPVTVVSKKKRSVSETGENEELFLARGEDGKIYEIPSNEVIYIGNINLRLINDLDEDYNNKKILKPSFGKNSDKDNNRSKVIRKESFSAGEPLFYSLILKVKELVIKELLISLISLRDLSSVQIFLLQFDKSTPLETANDLCARTTKLANNTNELASFLTSQFDVVSFIENTLSQSAKFVPDYNSTLGNKNSMLPLDKLSDKLLDLMQNLDNCKSSVLSPLGIPSTILDSTSGSKWAILQQSERANSKITGFMDGIKDSMTNLVCSIYNILYNKDIDSSLIKLHLTEKTSVEYNNQINQSESISGLVTGITGIITNSLATLDQAAPLIDTKSFLGYIQNLVKDIDPNTESIITDSTIENYVKWSSAMLKTKAEQQGIDASFLDEQNPEQNM
jgi:hypothetical protein